MGRTNFCILLVVLCILCISDTFRLKMEGKVQEAVKYISKTNCFSDVLEFSQELQYQDVTIICDGGKCHINSFLLASIFPIVKNIPISSLEDMIISLPDVKHKKLTEFFGNIHRKVFIKNVW